MRFRIALATVLLLAVAVSSFAAPSPGEQQVLDQFLKKAEKKHAPAKLGWLSLDFAANRVNRHNDYNSFTNHVNASLDGGKFSWLDNIFSVSGEFGMVFAKKFGWSVGGDYWLKAGNELSGTYQYTPAATGIPTALVNPKSEIRVVGAFAGLQYFLVNPPVASRESRGPSVKIGGTAGFYQAQWDLFPQLQNLNLSTALPDGTNTTFKGSAPAFSINMGIDYPVGIYGLQLSGQAGYLYMNFTNVAWYNEANQEVVASYNDAPDGRVDLNLSGIQARFGLKKFFSW